MRPILCLPQTQTSRNTAAKSRREPCECICHSFWQFGRSLVLFTLCQRLRMMFTIQPVWHWQYPLVQWRSLVSVSTMKTFKSKWMKILRHFFHVRKANSERNSCSVHKSRYQMGMCWMLMRTINKITKSEFILIFIHRKTISVFSSQCL